jgi:hypothetical protein
VAVIPRKLGAANRTQAVLLAGRLALESSEIAPLPEGVVERGRFETLVQ